MPRGDLITDDFQYDAWAFTLAPGQAVDVNAYNYISVDITTASQSLELARRGAASFGPFFNRQVIGDSAEGNIGMVRVRNNSNPPVTISGIIITSSRRVTWSDKSTVTITGTTAIAYAGAEGNNADGDAVKTSGVMPMDSYGNLFNGATWDRARGVSGAANVNNTLLAGNAIAAGSGVNGTGVQRVTLATDQAACSVAGLFSVKVDQTTDGTTNKVAAKLFCNATATPENVGAAAAGVPRMTLASPTGNTLTNSAATNNAANLKASAAQVFSVTAYNQSAAVRYLKLYNKATSPTVGTDVPVMVFAIPVNTHIAVQWSNPLTFSAGLGVGCVTGAAYTDNTATAANDVQFAINWQ